MTKAHNWLLCPKGQSSSPLGFNPPAIYPLLVGCGATMSPSSIHC